MDVIGVGGIDYEDRLAPFSSRGMTTWVSHTPNHTHNITRPPRIGTPSRLRASQAGHHNVQQWRPWFSPSFRLSFTEWYECSVTGCHWCRCSTSQRRGEIKG